jgi:hypothetical protein
LSAAETTADNILAPGSHSRHLSRVTRHFLNAIALSLIEKFAGVDAITRTSSTKEEDPENLRPGDSVGGDDGTRFLLLPS